MRELWRDLFARDDKFTSFAQPFPDGSYPILYRKNETNANGDANPEIMYWEYDKVAFFGLNRPDRDSYISNNATIDANEEWVKDRLGLDVNCTLESIVLISQTFVKQGVYDKIEDHFVTYCNKPKPPTLVITGDTHPKNYCYEKTDEKLFLTIEAFTSGPIYVSVVRGENGEGDFFHVKDTQEVVSNSQCSFDVR